MMSFPFGEALGAGASLIGSGLSFVGGQQAMGMNAGQNAFSNMIAQQQLDFEMAAAHHGIGWRVADAKDAGISPLVALGAPTFNPGAISVSGGNESNPYSGAGAGLVSMGQDLSRAAMVAQTEKTRAEAMAAVETARSNSALAQSTVERNLADAALARRRAEMELMPAMPPAAGGRKMVDGQGNAPDEHGAAPKTEPGYQWARTGDLTMERRPPPEITASASIFNPEYISWAARNRLFPDKALPPMEALPPGAVRWYHKGGGVYGATDYYQWEKGAPDYKPMR